MSTHALLHRLSPELHEMHEFPDKWYPLLQDETLQAPFWHDPEAHPGMFAQFVPLQSDTPSHREPFFENPE